MKPVLMAGSTFAAFSLGGLALGILLARQTGSQAWVFCALFLGMALGAFSAVRSLMRSS